MSDAAEVVDDRAGDGPGRWLPRALHPAHALVLSSAAGAEVVDDRGRRYIDFAGGIGVLNVGHGHPRVLAAAHRQLDRLVHTSAQVALYPDYLELVQRLVALAPGEFPKKAVLFSTGAEAVENTVKIARAWTGRPAVIAFSGAFHGRTLLGMSLTDAMRPYKEGFGPFAPEVYRAPYPYPYRGWDAQRAISGLEQLLGEGVAPDQVAAIVIEPVLGEGGFVAAPPEFMRRLRELCDLEGIVLVADEVQCGLGRTGRLFGIEHSGVVPDLVAVAKSLGGGLPISAVIGRAEIMDAPGPGSLGSTFGGNPVACAAALQVLAVIEEEGLLARARNLGAIMQERMEEWQRRLPLVGEVRVLGAMAGLELVEDRSTRRPAASATTRVLDHCRERGLLLLSSGPGHNVLRTLMPLTISDQLLDQGLDILEAALEQVGREPGGTAEQGGK
ncbi:MAG: 4-aminobutyrate--2-oxoglutarate transaminase [Candidatus Dormibacteria bacterium]